MSSQQISTRIEKGDITLQEFLSAWQHLSRNKAKALIDSRTVFVNGTRIWMARHHLKRGDQVQITITADHTSRSDNLKILFQGADYLIINKPAGCLSNGPDSVEQDLRNERSEKTLQAAHRLDRETSGCLLIARRQDAFDAITQCFKERRVTKIYHALVAGCIRETERHIEDPLDGEAASTQLRVLDRKKNATHISIKIDTGRTHQIRRHLALIGYPVLGDKQYGTSVKVSPELRTVERQMLHAYSIRFLSPIDGALTKAMAPLPADFKNWMKATRLA